MRTLVVYCHPNPESLVAAALERALAGLERGGHEVRVRDLYAEGFDPAMSADERRAHTEPGVASEGRQALLPQRTQRPRAQTQGDEAVLLRVPDALLLQVGQLALLGLDVGWETLLAVFGRFPVRTQRRAMMTPLKS